MPRLTGLAGVEVAQAARGRQPGRQRCQAAVAGGVLTQDSAWCIGWGAQMTREGCAQP
jgi:hypothetical protein